MEALMRVLIVIGWILAGTFGLSLIAGIGVLIFYGKLFFSSTKEDN